MELLYHKLYIIMFVIWLGNTRIEWKTRDHFSRTSKVSRISPSPILFPVCIYFISRTQVCCNGIAFPLYLEGKKCLIKIMRVLGATLRFFWFVYGDWITLYRLSYVTTVLVVCDWSKKQWCTVVGSTVLTRNGRSFIDALTTRDVTGWNWINWK